MNLHTNQKGFTIVELLIVIVVIAILAAISIVAYTGIQDRARDSAAEQLASQVAGKIRAYHAIDGSWPTGLTAGGELDPELADGDEADLEGANVASTTADPGAGTGEFRSGQQVLIQFNGSDAPQVWYRDGSDSSSIQL